jgi:hypothetical protein
MGSDSVRRWIAIIFIAKKDKDQNAEQISNNEYHS